MTLLKNFKNADPREKRAMIKEFLINNSLYIFLIAAVIVIQCLRPHFLSAASIVNIISLSAANLPIALGIAGAIILTGTDLSAGRIVGLVACVCASLLQASGYAGKMFPGLAALPLPIVFLIALAIGALIGLINGFCTAKFNLHPFIVTLSTQLIAYGALLMYLNIGNNNGQSISGLDASYTGFINGSILSIGKTPIPNYVWYSLLITVIMWFIWNKTTFGKNMFAVGSNPDEQGSPSRIEIWRVRMAVRAALLPSDVSETKIAEVSGLWLQRLVLRVWQEHGDEFSCRRGICGGVCEGMREPALCQKNSPPVVRESGRGPWDAAGHNFGMDMPEFCRAIAALGAKPGLWYRPLRAWDGLPKDQKLIANEKYLDPTVPSVRSRIVEDMKRFREWGFRLVKIDFLSYDIAQLWPCDPHPHPELFIQDDRAWRDDTRTTAEVMLDLYRAMRDAAGDDVVHNPV